MFNTSMGFQQNNGGATRGKPPAPPSRVLLIRSADLFGENLTQALDSVTSGLGDLPCFSQESKGISFVQFPSVDVASHVMEMINQGSIQTANGRPISAEFSLRAEVQDRKRPLDDGTMPAVKRERMVDDSAPSKVICVKTDQSEDDLLNMLSVTGCSVVNTLLVGGKNMVFVEFASFDESASVLNYVCGSGLQSKTGYNIDAMYSNRQQIVKSARPQSGGQQGTGFSQGGGGGGQVNQLTGSVNPLLSNATQQRRPRDEGPANRVILISLRAVSSAPTPTVDNLLPPFSYCGMIEKMIVFSKEPGQCQALVQYMNQEYAQLAVQKYHGTTLGSYNIQVRYSDRPELEVQKNSSMMRDFLNPWLPQFEGKPPQQQQQR